MERLQAPRGPGPAPPSALRTLAPSLAWCSARVQAALTSHTCPWLRGLRAWEALGLPVGTSQEAEALGDLKRFSRAFWTDGF